MIELWIRFTHQRLSVHRLNMAVPQVSSQIVIPSVEGLCPCQIMARLRVEASAVNSSTLCRKLMTQSHQTIRRVIHQGQ